jgi:Ca2+/Na+ antiporter
MEIQENEVITLLITAGVGFFFAANRKTIRTLPFHRTLMISYSFYLASLFFTVLEGFIWETVLNYLEHISMVAFSCTFFWWCWQMGVRRETSL